ncbi:MAG: 4'-phosphopantetheinyl transferase family protein [Syntrophomonadaceae bacterium]
MSTADWQIPKGKCILNQNEVNIWRVNAGSVSSSGLKDVLTPDELKKAYGYYFLKDQENFIISRGLLRVLIARYLNTSPLQINIHFNKYGKPYLKKSEGNLKFNVSHSNGTLLFAFTRNQEIGIDIEYIQHDFADLEIARHFFSRAEILALSVLPEDARVIGFFNCWTRKEAYIKAIGRGLSIPLDSFDVSVVPGETAELVRVHNNSGGSKHWRIVDLEVGGKFSAALAVKGNPNEIKYYEWTDEMYSNSSSLQG